MRAAVTVVMMDIVKSRTLQRRFRELVGTQADREYTAKVYQPCHDRVAALLAEHHGKLHDDVGDQFAAYFDHGRDAVQFAVSLQRLMSSSPIAVPDGCDCPHLQLHVAAGTGSMESDAYRQPGASRVLTFGDVARVLAITCDDQILITEEAARSAGQIDGATRHSWDVVLPKGGDRLTVIELLWDGRSPRQPKGK